MNGYCLRNGRLLEARPGGYEAVQPGGGLPSGGGRRAATFGAAALLSAELGEGEGLLLYGGEFRVEPLEIQIEFIKAVSAGEMAGGAGPASCGTGAGRGCRRLWALAVMKEVYE